MNIRRGETELVELVRSVELAVATGVGCEFRGAHTRLWFSSSASSSFSERSVMVSTSNKQRGTDIALTRFLIIL